VGASVCENFMFVCSRIFCYEKLNVHDSHNKTLSSSVSRIIPSHFNIRHQDALRQILMLFDEDVSTMEVASRRITRTLIQR
jgi:hypothetical protein